MSAKTETTAELQTLAAPPQGLAIPAVASTPERPPPEDEASTPPASTTGTREAVVELSKAGTVVVISSVTWITALGSFLAGLITVAIPTIAKDVNLSRALLLWPSSVFSLVCGCTLLLSGSISDVVGSRTMYLLGCLLQTSFSLACGLSQNGTQLLVFRAFAGLAQSFCLPSAVSIITGTFATGQRRNIAFAAMGGGQPLGFALGLVLGGIFTDTIGWRWGFYLAAISNALVLLGGMWGFPRNQNLESKPSWRRIKQDVDWVGALLISSALAMLSYVFASITTSNTNITDPVNLTLLPTSLALIPAFSFWVHRQEKLGLPALIPNSLWRSRTFTSICVCVFLSWGSFNSIEQLVTFYLQYVQKVSPLSTSLRILPTTVGGTVTNIITGILVHRVRADVLIITGAIISFAPPCLMAVASPTWSYWAAVFPTVTLNAVGADTLFTTSNLLITSSFASKDQGLAGGVFNTCSQIGKSIGMAFSAVIANSISAKAAAAVGRSEESPGVLLQGYKAAFWYCFALNGAALLFAAWGLRKIGKVGVKID